MINRIKMFFSNHIRDFAVISLLLFVYVIIAVYIGPLYGCLYIDSGRELYIPEAVLQGKVMYKEIFVLYCPFAYYINAFLYAIFGTSLDTLMFASYVNGFIITAGFYLILRVFLKEFHSAAFAFVIAVYYILGGFTSLLSFIFPYSYPFIYAVSFFVFSTLFFLYYMKDGNRKSLYVSAFLLGCVYACKFEFLFCIIPFFFVMLLKKENIKTFLISALLIMIPGLSCMAALFLQGASIQDFLDWMQFLKKTMYSPEYQFIEQHRIRMPWNLHTSGVMLRCFVAFVLYIGLNAFYISLCTKNKYYKLIAVIAFPFWLIINYYAFLDEVCNYTENIFCWHVVVLALIMVYKLFKLKDVKEQMLFYIAVCGILAMYRINFMPLERYNYTVYFFTSLIPLWVWFIDFKIEKIKNYDYKYYVSGALIVFSLFFLTYRESVRNWSYKELNFKGTHLIAEERHVDSLMKSVEWLKNNAKQTDTVLVLPEGVSVNFFSGNPTVLKYYQLTPNHIPGFGEEKIVEDLNKNKPEYIFMTNTAFLDYNVHYICNGFAARICDFTDKNYDFKEEIKTYNNGQDIFSTRIYKLKD